MVNEFKAVHEMNEKIPSIMDEIKKVSEKYEADTLATGMTFLHMLFDHFVHSQKLDHEKTYIRFAHDGIKTAREAKELLDILSEDALNINHI